MIKFFRTAETLVMTKVFRRPTKGQVMKLVAKKRRVIDSACTSERAQFRHFSFNGSLLNQANDHIRGVSQQGYEHCVVGV